MTAVGVATMVLVYGIDAMLLSENVEAPQAATPVAESQAPEAEPQTEDEPQSWRDKVAVAMTT